MLQQRPLILDNVRKDMYHIIDFLQKSYKDSINKEIDWWAKLTVAIATVAAVSIVINIMLYIELVKLR